MNVMRTLHVPAPTAPDNGNARLSPPPLEPAAVVEVSVRVNAVGRIDGDGDPETPLHVQWLKEASVGKFGPEFGDLGRPLWERAGAAGVEGVGEEEWRAAVLRFENFEAENSLACRAAFLRAMRRVFFSAGEDACKDGKFLLTVDLEGVSDGEGPITPPRVGLERDLFNAVAAGATLTEAMAALDWDALDALEESLTEAGQLKAADELLDGKRLTLRNVNEMLGQSNRRFDQHERANLLRLVRYFEARGKQLYMETGDDGRVPCTMSIHLRKKGGGSMFDVNPGKAGKRRQTGFLPEGLSLA